MNNEYLHQNGQLALEVLPEAIIIVDNNHVIQFINSAAVRLFRIPDVRTFLGSSFSVFPGGTGLKTYSQRVAYHNHINEVALQEIPGPQPNDEQQWSTDVDHRYFHFRATPMCNEQNPNCGFIISVHEWSGEHKASELLAALFSDLLMPFQVIRGYSELLLKEDPSNPLTNRQRELVNHINEKAKKLLELRETLIVDYKKQVEGNKISKFP